MEDTLREDSAAAKSKRIIVLILVLMEDTLREEIVSSMLQVILCLNPCFNGRYSQRIILIITIMEKKKS